MAEAGSGGRPATHIRLRACLSNPDSDPEYPRTGTAHQTQRLKIRGCRSRPHHASRPATASTTTAATVATEQLTITARPHSPSRVRTASAASRPGGSQEAPSRANVGTASPPRGSMPCQRVIKHYGTSSPAVIPHSAQAPVPWGTYARGKQHSHPPKASRAGSRHRSGQGEGPRIQLPGTGDAAPAWPSPCRARSGDVSRLLRCVSLRKDSKTFWPAQSGSQGQACPTPWCRMRSLHSQHRGPLI